MFKATMRQLAEQGVSETPEVVLADAGFWHHPQMQTTEQQGIEVLVPPDGNMREGKRRGWEEGVYQQMRDKLSTDRGRKLYAQRKITIEPVFGQIKYNRHIDRFMRRGRSAARSEWRLVIATHNLLKLHSHWIATPGLTPRVADPRAPELPLHRRRTQDQLSRSLRIFRRPLAKAIMRGVVARGRKVSSDAPVGISVADARAPSRRRQRARSCRASARLTEPASAEGKVPVARRRGKSGPRRAGCVDCKQSRCRGTTQPNGCPLVHSQSGGVRRGMVTTNRAHVGRGLTRRHRRPATGLRAPLRAQRESTES